MLVSEMETVCLWVLPTTYQSDFLPSQHSPDPALKWGIPLLFPWVNTTTFCKLVCQVSNERLFLLVLWGAHIGHLSGMWLILNHCEKRGGQQGKFFQPRWASKSLRSCAVSRTAHFLMATGKQMGISKRGVKIPGGLLWPNWEVRPQYSLVLSKRKWDTFSVWKFCLHQRWKLTSGWDEKSCDFLSGAWMPRRSHSQQPQWVSYSVPCWAWKQVCLQNRTYFWNFDWLRGSWFHRKKIAGRKGAQVSCEGKENKHSVTDISPVVLPKRTAVDTDGEEHVWKGVGLATQWQMSQRSALNKTPEHV